MLKKELQRKTISLQLFICMGIGRTVNRFSVFILFWSDHFMRKPTSRFTMPSTIKVTPMMRVRMSEVAKGLSRITTPRISRAAESKR